jgi:hypothetical protein
VFGLRAEQRHTNHRGTIQGGTLSCADVSLAVEGREIVRARAVWVVAGRSA